ncbi:unnamed protein product [Staurois parvus]|uniref:Secreted protein n=1 Tax=Staurois parvus TaxID=386267 RepID=A0ABN9HUC8_9NEOB|nr:unnamed protein product [Staurois parvus]
MCVPVHFLCIFDVFYCVPVQFCAGKMQSVLRFFLQPERTGPASTDGNSDIDNHRTYFLCILDAEKKATETHVV